MQHRSVIFIGLRASGKSTVAAAVAAALRLPVIDLDVLVASDAGVETAAELIQSRGIDEFRRAEGAALRRLLDDPSPKVISLGGGTPTAPGAAALLGAHREHCCLLYLRASPQILRSRLAATDLSLRPSLTGASVLDEVETLHAARDPIYRQLATHTVEVDGLDSAQTVEAVLKVLTAA
jgi:shikimate kinase